MSGFARNWVEIDAARLAGNLLAVQSVAGEADVLAVVKADAYGHGAELCAPILARAGARWFGVTDAAEGVRVRLALERAGFGESEIMVMSGSLPEESAALGEARLTPVVWTPEQVRALSHLPRVKVHIEVDTAMGRQGARPGAELHALLNAVREAGLERNLGLFTHLCSSEVAHSPLTAVQRQRFESAVTQVRAFGVEPEWLHVANSSAIDTAADVCQYPAALAHGVGAKSMVRAGLALYGYVLPVTDIECGSGLETRQGPLGPKLQPVLTWKARVLAVRELEPGESVGYGATFRAPRTMRAALLPVGYADGLRRELSNPGTTSHTTGGGWAMSSASDGTSARCPIVGRISMNLTVVDASAAPWLSAGDVVTLLGQGVTAAEHARIAGTIPYEILCGLRGSPHTIIQANK